MTKLLVPILVDWESIKNYMGMHDIVEVVRCKDCRWWERDYQPRYHPDERPCNRVEMGTSPDWYCADNERRDDER